MKMAPMDCKLGCVCVYAAE